MNQRAVWMAARVLLVAIGAMSTVAYIAAMPHWLIALGLGVLAGAFTLLYKMICEWEVVHHGVSSKPKTKSTLPTVSPAARITMSDRSAQSRKLRPLLPTLLESDPTVGGLEPGTVTDAISALGNLGYSAADARYAITRVRQATVELDDDFNGLVRAALDDLHLRRAV